MTSPVLRRASAQREVLAVAALVLLVSVVLVTACGIALRVATEAGVAAGLDRSAPTDRVVVVSGNPDDAEGLDRADQAVRALLTSSLAPADPRVVRRTVSASYAVQGGAEGDRLLLGQYDGARDHARLVAGAWPEDAGGATGVAVPEAAAAALDLAPGDPLTLEGQDGRALRVVVTGVWSADDPTEGWWAGDVFGGTGVRRGGGFRTFGPLFVADEVEDGGLGLLVDPRVSWLAEPALTTLSGDELGAIADRLSPIAEEGPRQLTGDLPDVEVTTGLDTVLRGLGPALSAARTAVLVPALLLLALALTSLVLAARVVAQARASDVWLRESRGFSRGQVLRESAAEMAVVGVLVLVAAPWLAPPVVDGVLAAAGADGTDTGLRATDWAWPLVTVLVGVLLLTRAAASSGRRTSGLRSRWRRLPSARQVLEVAVLVLAVVAWQQSSGPVSADGVLVRAAAPVLVVVAMLVVLAHLVPLLSRAGSAALVRARAIVPSVVTWELTRRADQQRAALLTTGLAAAVSVLLAGLLGSWSASQDEQAAVRTAADVRVTGLTTEQATALADQVGGAVVERRSTDVGGAAGTVVVGSRADLARVLVAPSPAPWDELLDRLSPSGEERVPVLVSRAVDDRAGQGSRLSLRIDGDSVPADVVGTLPAFPTADPGALTVLVDEEALRAVVGRVPPASVSTDSTELWTSSQAKAPDGATVLSRTEVEDALRNGPVGTGLVVGSALALLAAAMLGVLAALSETATTLHARRGELAALRAQGLSRGSLVAAVGIERGALLVGSSLLGGLVGWATLRLLLRRLVVGDTGLLPVPAASTVVPWLVLLASIGLAVTVLSAFVVGSASRVAQRPLGIDLRSTT